MAKSLVTMTRNHSGAVRYGMLETVRHYAEDRLIDDGEVAECQTRHYRHFLDVVRSVPFLMGDFRGLNASVIRPEAVNIEAAVQRAKERVQPDPRPDRLRKLP